QAALQQSMVTLAKVLEGFLKTKLHADERITGSRRFCGIVLMAAQEKLSHCWNNGAREQIGSQHGKYDGFTERHEQIARYAGEQKHRNKDNANRERRDERRHSNLLSAVENGVFHFLPQGDISIDVFDLNCRVVHEDSY